MLDLNQLTVFIRVVDEGSFTAAGKALGMPKSRVSRMVADLEASLGARLLQRTTRQLSMTEVGSAYYSRCRHLVHEIIEAHEMISDREGNPQGLLRIAVPMMAGSGVMGHYFARYQAQYPDVRLEVIHTDRPVNLIQEGFDLGVYLGDLPDSSLIARTLAESDSVLCAAPSYLARVGRPLHPHDLVQMRCVKIGEGSQPQTYELTHNETGEVVEVKVEPTISTNSVVASVMCITCWRVNSFLMASWCRYSPTGVYARSRYRWPTHHVSICRAKCGYLSILWWKKRSGWSGCWILCPQQKSRLPPLPNCCVTKSVNRKAGRYPPLPV